MKFTNHIKSTVQLYICKAKYQFYAFLTYAFKGHPYFASKKLKLGSILIAVTLTMCNYQQKSQPIKSCNEPPKEISNKVIFTTAKNSAEKNKKKSRSVRKIEDSGYKPPAIIDTGNEITCYLSSIDIPVVINQEIIIPDDTIPFVKLTCDSIKGKDSTKFENSK